MKRVIVFDVNETLLDLSVLAPHFDRLFGDASLMRLWFAHMLHSSLVVTLTGNYADFGTVAGAALAKTAAQRQVTLPAEGRDALLGTIRSLPPHADVADGLARLRDAGYRLATLTNSTAAVVAAQLDNAGLTEFFERRLTVDDVGYFKLAAEAYHMAAASLGVARAQIRLVAAHDWDVAGALHAGCAAAYLARPGQQYSSLLPRPDIVGSDLRVVSEMIVARDSQA